MASVTVRWQASKSLLMQELMATGQAGPAERTIDIDLVPLQPEQRTALLALTDPIAPRTFANDSDISLRTIDITSRLEFRTDSFGRAFKTEFSQDVPLVDAATVLAAVARRLQLEAPAKAAILADEAKKAAEKAAKREETARHLAAYNDMLPRLQALIAAGDYASLEKANQTDGPVDRPAWYNWSWGPSDGESLFRIQSDGLRQLREAAQAAEKAAWIEAHGSTHLKRACREYNCQRLYVTERAALEAPGFVVDFNDAAAWKDRSCPTETALNVEEAARSLGLGEPVVVWLTKPPQAADRHDVDDYDVEEFESCEAVVLIKYLGKYDLVQIVA